MTENTDSVAAALFREGRALAAAVTSWLKSKKEAVELWTKVVRLLVAVTRVVISLLRL